MAFIIACVSQKGGVAKSSLARLVAREYAARGADVLLADMDAAQETSAEWARRRVAAGIAPAIRTAVFGSVTKAVKAAQDRDILVIDARGFADRQTEEAAGTADALVLPTGLAVDDLLPSVRLAHELVTRGIDKERLTFALCRTADSAREIEEAHQYVQAAGYRCVAPVWPERAGYRQAHDEGRAATEARHPALRARARRFADALISFVDPFIRRST
jgi:chromosome partitioning protein